MTIGSIIAFMAMFIAFVALWLVSDVLKKVETQNEKFLRAHIKTLREEMREIDNALVKVKKQLPKLEEAQTVSDQRISDQTGHLDDLASRLAGVTEKLDTLDKSIPSRYRTRVVKPKENEAAQPRPKPTVQ